MQGCWAIDAGRMTGTYSSMTTWALVPLKPNALTAARRLRPATEGQS